MPAITLPSCLTIAIPGSLLFWALVAAVML
jgi:hypothetical protein